MTMMSNEHLSELRRYVARATSSADNRDLVGHLTMALSSLARRAMLPVDATRFLITFNGLFPDNDLASPIRAMLVELEGYGVTMDEFRVLKDFCSGGAPEALVGLRKAIDAALYARLFGVSLEAHYHAEIESFIASECDSVALAAASLLRAVQVGERGLRRLDLEEGALRSSSSLEADHG